MVGRLRSDRALRLPAPPRVYQPKGGRPPKHGTEFGLAKPGTWPEPSVMTVNDTPRYGKAEARAWDRLHPELQQRSAWIDHEGELPIIEGTLIRLKVDHLPGDRDAPPVWLWSSATGATPADVDFAWSCYLRRFDLEMSKPQCCHSCGSSSSPWAPVSFWIIAIRWWYSQGWRAPCPRGSSCRRRSRSTSARSA
ncbi:transposase [Streptomyces sp. R41]|uniref:Transposase n=1 Tax=Streptomyces sp. R41 TaxID=3238632 RepID=A0AB39RRE1_9ACTN